MEVKPESKQKMLSTNLLSSKEKILGKYVEPSTIEENGG